MTSRGADKMADRSGKTEPKWVYAFAAGYVDGRANMTELLGGRYDDAQTKAQSPGS
jgi:hypothetical protein